MPCPELGKSLKTERLVVAQCWVEGEMRTDFWQVPGVFIGGYNILKLDCGDGCATLNVLKEKKPY